MTRRTSDTMTDDDAVESLDDDMDDPDVCVHGVGFDAPCDDCESDPQ
jgi:hypothetical protein